MKSSIAFKVVSVYLLIMVGSLGLAGILTNSAIQHYVISAARSNLIIDGRKVIKQFILYGNSNVQADVTVAAQQVSREYIVVGTSGTIIWNTFSNQDIHLLAQVSDVVVKALQGHVATGLYPVNSPVFEFVAIPFTYNHHAVPLPQIRPGSPSTIFLSNGGGFVDDNKKVVVLFTRLSDLQRITTQIWLSVAQGLLIASLITAIVGVTLARRLMRPAALIQRAIMRVRERDFSDIPVIRTNDEWGQFASAFGDMVRSLQAFDEGQKRFLQNASHELKTPLMAIRGYAEGLRDGVFEPSEAFRILDIVAQESVRLKGLVDELIYLSKLETLEEVYTFVPYDLSMVIYKTIERVYPLAQERGIHILPDVPDAPVIALIDPDKMVQALLNITSNAIRHAQRQIFVRLTGKDGVTIVVEDDGEGFHDDDENRVFERFFHGAKGDTGLGLPIAKAIITKHKGEITALNAAGSGARFVISLPTQ